MSLLDELSSIIPESINSDYILKKNAFSRERSLPLKKLLSFTLSAASAHKNSSIATRLNEFFSTTNTFGLWKNNSVCSSSAVSKARQKIHWNAFHDMFLNAVSLAKHTISDKNHLWHDMQVIAIDGSKYTLPHTKDIVEEFDPNAGLQNSGKGHYPQCIVLTAYDALAEIPLSSQLMPVHTSERSIAMALIPSLPKGAVLLHDRGFPSFKYQYFLHNNYDGHYLMRCKASHLTFSAVSEFIKSGKSQDIITIVPSACVLKELSEDQHPISPVIVRALRVQNPVDKTISVLLTTLLDFNEYSYEELVDLYFKRWPIEVHFRNEKCTFEIEKFHTRSINGIKQEFFAVATVTVIARILTHIEFIEKHNHKSSMPQFKNAVICFAMYAAVLVPDEPLQALKVFDLLLENIKRVRYYKHKTKRKGFPRVSKKAPNKWCQKRMIKITQCKA